MSARDQGLSKRSLAVLLGALTAFDPLTIDMYLPAFGAIQRELGTTVERVELSVTTFFVGMALGQLIYGPLADRFGRKRPLLAGMLLYFCATLGCAAAPSIELFVAFRLLQALGGCAGMVVTRAIIRDLFDPREGAVFLSNMALVMGLAPITAPSIGALISHGLGWRAIFVTLALANALCIAAILRWLPETNAAPAPTLRVRDALARYGGLLRDRSFVGYLLPDTAIRAGMFAYIAGSPFVFITLLGVPASRYGLLFGLNALGLIGASQVNRLLLRRWSPAMILRWSVRAAPVAATLVLLAGWSRPSPWLLLPAIFLFLATLNFVGPNALAQAMSSQARQAGAASALYGSAQWSLASLSSMLVSRWHDGTARPMVLVIFACGAGSLLAYQRLVAGAPDALVEPRAR